MYRCNQCKEDENIILWEYLWAYDWCMALMCNSCNTKSHLRTWYKILAEKQLPDYWPMMFILEHPETKFPLRYINQFVYNPSYKNYDKEFEELEESLFI